MTLIETDHNAAQKRIESTLKTTLSILKDLNRKLDYLIEKDRLDFYSQGSKKREVTQ